MALFGANGLQFGPKGAIYLGATLPSLPPLTGMGPQPPSNSACLCCCSCPPNYGGGPRSGSYKKTKTLTISGVNTAAALGTCWPDGFGLFSYRFNSLPVNGTFTLTLRAQYVFAPGTVACFYALEIPASSDQWTGNGCSGVLQFHCTVMHFELITISGTGAGPFFDGVVALLVYLTNPAPPLNGQRPSYSATGQGPIIGFPGVAEANTPVSAILLGTLYCGGSVTDVSNVPPVNISAPGDNFGSFGIPGFGIGGYFGGTFVVTDG